MRKRQRDRLPQPARGTGDEGHAASEVEAREADIGIRHPATVPEYGQLAHVTSANWPRTDPPRYADPPDLKIERSGGVRDVSAANWHLQRVPLGRSQSTSRQVSEALFLRTAASGARSRRARSRRGRRCGGRPRAGSASTGSARGSRPRGRSGCTRRRAACRRWRPRAAGSTSRRRSFATPSPASTQKTEPTGSPSSAAIQARSRAGSWLSANSATICATSASKLVSKPYSRAYSAPWRWIDPAVLARERRAQDERGSAGARRAAPRSWPSLPSRRAWASGVSALEQRARTARPNARSSSAKAARPARRERERAGAGRRRASACASTVPAAARPASTRLRWPGSRSSACASARRRRLARPGRARRSRAPRSSECGVSSRPSCSRPISRVQKRLKRRTRSAPVTCASIHRATCLDQRNYLSMASICSGRSPVQRDAGDDERDARRARARVGICVSTTTPITAATAGSSDTSSA